MKKRQVPSEPVGEELLTPKERAYAAIRKFEVFYFQLVIGCGCVLIMGIVVAVLVSVLVGILIFLAGCGIYLYFLRDELKKRLGLKYRRGEDGWAVTPVARGEDEELWIPERLMWLEVTELFRGEEPPCEGIRALHLSAGIKLLEEGLFDRLPNLETICFLGTEEQWQAVIKPDVPLSCEVAFVTEDRECFPKEDLLWSVADKNENQNEP
ncbi:MAG: hypothetical protein IJY47_02300 [Clostridia bacterium]|nr:hypothetical protein [Clostridia bacterium]